MAQAGAAPIRVGARRAEHALRAALTPSSPWVPLPGRNCAGSTVLVATCSRSARRRKIGGEGGGQAGPRCRAHRCCGPSRRGALQALGLRGAAHDGEQGAQAAQVGTAAARVAPASKASRLSDRPIRPAKTWSAASRRSRFCAAGPLAGPRVSIVSIRIVRARSIAWRTVPRPARAWESQPLWCGVSASHRRVGHAGEVGQAGPHVGHRAAGGAVGVDAPDGDRQQQRPGAAGGEDGADLQAPRARAGRHPCRAAARRRADCPARRRAGPRRADRLWPAARGVAAATVTGMPHWRISPKPPISRPPVRMKPASSGRRRRMGPAGSTMQVSRAPSAAQRQDRLGEPDAGRNRHGGGQARARALDQADGAQVEAGGQACGVGTRVQGGAAGGGRQAVLFKKKDQKTFGRSGACCGEIGTSNDQKFFASFFSCVARLHGFKRYNTTKSATPAIGDAGEIPPLHGRALWPETGRP